MKSDTDQLVHLIKSVQTYSVAELCPELNKIHDERDASIFLGIIANRHLTMPKGTVFKVAGLDRVLQRTNILIISGDIHTGNVILCVDRPALDLETVLYGRSPSLVGVVKSISFPGVNSPRAVKAIKGIIKTYQDMVLKIQIGVLSSDYSSETLLNFVHEYVLTNKIISEFTPEVYD